jgi:predicted DNA-binding transcriptional regulator AlpA
MPHHAVLGAANAAPAASRRRAATYIPDDPLLTPREAAAERRQALSSFWRDVRRGLVPPAIYVSPRCPRWRRSEIRAALEACRAPRKGNPAE